MQMLFKTIHKGSHEDRDLLMDGNLLNAYKI